MTRTYEYVELTGGRWVLDPWRRVQIWHPMDAIQPVDADPIGCHKCGATIYQTCRSKSGFRTKDHLGRTPRVCGCGGAIEPGKGLCDACRRERHAESRRGIRERRMAA